MIECGARAAELIDPHVIDGGPDILAANEAEPAQALIETETASARGTRLAVGLAPALANMRLLSLPEASDICRVPPIE
jgi:hypothetical protein